MAAKDKDLNDLFLDTLKDIYFAEKQILKALPKMARAAQSDKLRAAFEKHHGETEGQVDRLEQVFKILDAPARGKTCEAIKGILDEGKEIMDEYEGHEALDAGLLAAAQAVEHYEISRYGTLKQWALQLGMKDVARLLDQTLQQEKKTDNALSLLAEAELAYSTGVKRYASGEVAEVLGSAAVYTPRRRAEGASPVNNIGEKSASDEFSPEDWLSIKHEALRLLGAKLLDPPAVHLAYIQQRLARAS
jgi:ferritin-like metal-binding protein YciE